MLPEKRFLEILKRVDTRGTVTVRELVSGLSISESTVRRDLLTLHEMGRLTKVHGGAISLASTFVMTEEDVQERSVRYREEKMRIARAAAALIRPDDCVYLDAGTTTVFLAESAVPNGAVFVTNAAFHANILARNGCSVYLPGGRFKPVTEAVVGGETVESLAKYHFTKGFFGTNGVSLTGGFTTPDAEEAMVKAAAFARCRERWILADPSKFGVTSSVTFGNFESATILTTRLKDIFFRTCPNVRQIDEESDLQQQKGDAA